MSITRRLPRTSLQRKRALAAAIAKNNAVGQPNDIINLTLSDDLDDAYTLYNGLLLAEGVAKAQQSSAVTAANPARKLLEKYILAYFKTINNAISIDLMEDNVRAYYGLPINSDILPVVNTDDLLRTWTQTIIDGDAARVSAGGAAMVMPTMVQFNTVQTDAIAKINTVSIKKDAYNTAQNNTLAANGGIDIVILRVWDAVEAYFNTGDAADKRRFAREWGVMYKSVGEPMELDTVPGGGAAYLEEELVKDTTVAHIDVPVGHGGITVCVVSEVDGDCISPTLYTLHDGRNDFPCSAAGATGTPGYLRFVDPNLSGCTLLITLDGGIPPDE